MTLASDVRDLMKADTTTGVGLNVILTGGIYTFKELGRMGLTPTSKPAAYTNGILKPAAVVRQRTRMPLPGTRDGKFQTEIGVVEVYFLQDGDGDYSVIDAALTRSYTVLQGARKTSWHDCEYVGEFNDLRELELDDACKARQDWRITLVRSG